MSHVGPWERLSPRQRQVLRLVACGLHRNEIASQLRIKPGTVRQHVENIRCQLGVRTQAAAVHKAHVLGILSVDDPT